MPIYSKRPSGPAGGQLSGSYPDPQVINLSGSATGSFTGSFFGTISDATTAQTASYISSSVAGNVIDVSSSIDALRITQRGTGNAILVEDSNNPDGTPFVVDGNGRVGIGTLTPTGSALVHVVGDIMVSASALPTGREGSKIKFYDENAKIYRSGSSGNIVISTLDTDRVTVTSTGNVGIGTNTPAYTLDITNTGTARLANSTFRPTKPYAGITTSANSDSRYSGMNISNENISNGAEFKVLTGDQTSSLKYGLNNTGFTGSSGVMGTGSDAYIELSNLPSGPGSDLWIANTTKSGSKGNIYFAVGASAVSASSTPPLFISKDGTVGVGTNNPAATLEVVGNVKATSFTGSLLGTASYATTTLTASYINPLTQSAYIQGSLSASSGITGSFSGSAASLNQVQISDYLRLLPVGNITIPTDQSSSYIYTSGSTNDLYFTQYAPPYTNTTRLRWLEGALNTGLLHGGILSTTNGTNTFNISSGSGLIVTFNAFTSSDPYPTINFVNFTGSSNIPLQYSASAQITYISLDSNGHVVQKTTPPTFSDFKSSIVIGRVLHQSGSVTNGTINTPPTAYGVNSNVADFVRAIGPLKINGHFLAASGSTTLALTKTSGDSYVEGRNYSLDPNIPNIVLAANDLPVTTTKIFRQYMSGSTPIIDTGVAGAGYPVLDATKYQLPNGTTDSVGTDFTVQRVFWFPRAVNNALFVYYGQAKYTNIDDAIAGVSTENFVEGDNTRTSAILVGYIVIKGNETNFNSTATSRIYQAGLFRGGTGGGGGSTGGATNLSSLTDVLIGSQQDGEALVWSASANKWVDGVPANAGYATSAGSAATASYINPLTQSVSISGNLSASSGITGSFSGSATNLSLFSTTNGGRGVVPGSNGSSSYFLKGDGTWSAATGTLGGVGLANYLSKWIDSTTLSSSGIYQSAASGKIGIGTTSPSDELTVIGTTRSTEFQAGELFISGTNGVSGSIQHISKGGDGSSYLLIQSVANANNKKARTILSSSNINGNSGSVELFTNTVVYPTSISISMTASQTLDVVNNAPVLKVSASTGPWIGTLGTTGVATGTRITILNVGTAAFIIGPGGSSPTSSIPEGLGRDYIYIPGNDKFWYTIQ